MLHENNLSTWFHIGMFYSKNIENVTILGGHRMRLEYETILIDEFDKSLVEVWMRP